jgi:hypothetical protein
MRASVSEFRQSLGLAPPVATADLGATLDELGGWLRRRSGEEE